MLRDTTSIQRGIIRHVYLVIDLSMSMMVREYKATWLDLTLQYAQVRPAWVSGAVELTQPSRSSLASTLTRIRSASLRFS